MALTLFTKDMNVIAALADEPNDAGGLGADELKAKFDEGGNAIKNYINNVLIPETEASIEAAAQGVPSGDGIDGTIIVDGSITTPKYAAGSVTTPVIADEAVTTEKVAPRSITGAKVALSTIGRENLTDDARLARPEDFPSFSVPGNALADNSLTTQKYADASVTAAKLAADAKTLVFEVTLLAANWTDNTQIISSANFITGGCKYDVAPAPASFLEYAENVIFANDVTVDGQMTFSCQNVPANDLTAYISRVVTA